MVVALLLIVSSACSTPPLSGPASQPTFGPAYAPVPDGIAGERLYRSSDTQAARWAKANPGSGWLAPLLQQPQARWINGPDDLASLRRASLRAARTNRLLVGVVYAIPNRGCDNYHQGSVNPTAYRTFIQGVVKALGSRPTVLVLEPDALPADCYTAARGRLLHWATVRLTRAGYYVYIDAGHSGWRPSGEMATRLIESGITEASGFALNVSARSTTADGQRYGEELSDLVGQRPYLIDTSRNGLGPTPDQPGRSGWCNPDHQALGTRPSTRPIGHNVARLWIKSPGESDGTGAGCGDETAYPGLFSPRQARRLIDGAPWVGERERRRLPAENTIPRTR